MKSKKSPVRKRITQHRIAPKHKTDPTTAFNQEEEVERIFEAMKRFDGVKWLRLMKEKLRVPTSRTIAEPDIKHIDKLFRGKPSFFLPSQGKPMALKDQKKAKPQKSFGYVGSYVRLESRSAYVKGIIGIRFDPKLVGSVDPQTLRVFHWDVQSKQYLMIPGSHVVIDKSFVWANISRPGNYALIGLNTNPPVFWTIRALGALDGFLQSIPTDIRNRVRARICRVILCAPQVTRAASRPDIAAMLADSLSALGHNYPANGFANVSDLCDLCLGDDIQLPPEMMIPPDDSGRCDSGPWESLGPTNVAGPVFDLALDPTDATRLYAACHDAGIWRLDNFDSYPTRTFQPLTDSEFNLRMQAVAVSRTGIVFAGNFMGPDSARLLRSAEARGILRWTDPSEREVPGTAEPIWENHISINRIITDTRDENILYLASGDGFKRSSDGGGTWRRLVRGNVADAARDSSDETKFYLAIAGRGVVRCIIGDGAAAAVEEDLLTLTQINALVPAWRSAGPPDNQRSLRIALGYRRSDGRVERVDRRTVAAKSGAAIFLSRNSGEPGTWALVKEPTDGDQGGWNNCIAIDPYNSDIIISGNVDLIRSLDGGEEWRGIGEPAHEDRHCLLFHGSRPNVVFVASDGGVNLSHRSGERWEELNRDFVTGDMISVGVHEGLAASNFDHQHVWGNHAHEGRAWEYLGGHEWDHQHSNPHLPNRFYWGRGEGLYRLKWDGSGWTRNLLSDFDASKGTLAIGSGSLSRAMLCAGGNSDRGYKLYLTLDCDPPTGEWRSTFDARPQIPQAEWLEVLSPGGGSGDNEVKSVTFGAYDTNEAYAVTWDGRFYYSDDVLRAGSWSVLPELRLLDGGPRQLCYGTSLYSLSQPVSGSPGLRRLVRNEITGARSWVPLASPLGDSYRFISVLSYPEDENVILVATNAGLFCASENDLTWVRLDNGLPFAEISGVIRDAGYLYVSTYGRGLWRKRLDCI